ncbi:MAG TPA: inorganic diphosphatase [Chitinophagaceae bacterium]|nr:inorganic diphosphatase [Chitinophagaceae bacterium]
MQPITAIVETPKGSPQKYDWDEELRLFKLSKILPAGLQFPFDFGFIPGTRGEDGDPLDVIIISEVKSFTGCCMDCRVIGAITADQTERDGKTVRNDRFLAVPEVSQLFKNVHSFTDLPEDILKQLEAFFKNYNEQAGKEFQPLDRINATEALALIHQGRDARDRK